VISEKHQQLNAAWATFQKANLSLAGNSVGIFCEVNPIPAGHLLASRSTSLLVFSHQQSFTLRITNPIPRLRDCKSQREGSFE